VIKRFKSPIPTVDIIIECETNDGRKGIVLIYRKNPPIAWAIPGGYVDYGESVETAAVREAKEETSLDVTLIRQFHTYSDPERDPRQHNISIVFIAVAQGEPRAADDATAVDIFTSDDLTQNLAFDHEQILDDYFQKRY
jgi:ADP-ribose pyrophosphatase YjhB (NUDIX family)